MGAGKLPTVFMSTLGTSQTSIAGLPANPSGCRLLDPVRAFHLLALKPVVPRARQFAITLTCVLALSSFLYRAAAQVPEGLAEALIAHTWSFPAAKPPIYFHADGNVIDGDYHLRFTWQLDADTGTVHLLEYKYKAKYADKAKIDLWFAKDLNSFTWYDSRTNASGVGTRIEDPANAKTPPVAAQEPAKASLAFDPKTAPSAQLQAFSTAWLDKLTGPLDNAPLPHAQIIQMQTDYQAQIGVATPAQKPAYQAALQACVIFGNLMDAREKARTALTNAQANASGEVGTARRGARSDANARNDSKFVAAGAANAAISQWQQQQKPWRDAIQLVLAREKQAEVIANNPSDNAVTHK
jgi:hypothetical protein